MTHCNVFILILKGHIFYRLYVFKWQVCKLFYGRMTDWNPSISRYIFSIFSVIFWFRSIGKKEKYFTLFSSVLNSRLPSPQWWSRSHIVLKYNNENVRFIRLLSANRIAYIFRSNGKILYHNWIEKKSKILKMKATIRDGRRRFK